MRSRESEAHVNPEVTDPATLVFSQAGADAPHEAYRRLHDRCPVARSEFGGAPAVYLSRYDDVLWALRHPEIFSSDVEALSIGQEQPLIPLQVDPPEHTRYRRLLNPEFVPRKIAELEADVRVLVNGIIDTFADRGHCDFHDEFATPLPSTIFLRLMGLPQADLPMFLQWRDDIVRPDVAPDDFDGAERVRAAAGQAINAYFERSIEDRGRTPDAGLLSRLVQSEIDGVHLTRRELLGISHLMLLGGLDTVTATLDCMVANLARHPERRRRLVEAPSLVPAAVEELLRRESPVMVVLRILTRDISVGGVELRAGDHVTLVIGAANADAREFPDGEVVDIDREPNRHLAFGAGNHLCLGAHLARLELRVALEELHRRIPDYRIADDTEIHYSPGIRQADHLPLVFEPARREVAVARQEG
ncbi:MAG: cytochrome P450 [Actinobacteria bacterium]|nr:MAG: cytochrome P450 [Actinomycetota bacterium]